MNCIKSQLHTFVANQVNITSMLGNTYSVILHPRTPPEIPNHENLDMLISRRLGRSIACGYGIVVDPCQENDRQASRNDGEDENGHHISPRCLSRVLTRRPDP